MKSSYRAKKNVADVIDAAKFALPGTAMRQARDVRWQNQVCEIGQLLLDQIGQRIAPEFAPGTETLGADRAVPVGAIGPDTAPAQYVAVLIGLGTLLCRD